MFLWEMEAMDKCDETMDLIVLPESTDVPCFAKTRDMALVSYNKFNKKLIDPISLIYSDKTTWHPPLYSLFHLTTV